MIDRYSREEMSAIWSDQHRIDTWLAVEKAVCEAWARRGTIPEFGAPGHSPGNRQPGAHA